MIRYRVAEIRARRNKLRTVLVANLPLSNVRLRRVGKDVVGFENAKPIPLAYIEISSSGDVAVIVAEFS
jgi:hypothetical protein